jgi:hypothetical protein
MFSKILAPIITPNATAGTMNLSAVFTRVEVLKHLHHSIGQSSNFPIQRDKGGTASSKIRPNSTVCNKAGKLLIMVTSVPT